MSVAGVNSIGRGLFGDPVEVQIGTGKYIVSSNELIYTFYSVPVSVGTLSSLMSTIWAVMSCNVPSYIPVDYSIITYEIGYTTHQSNCGYSLNDEFNPMIKINTSSRNVTISDLIGNTCYMFGVCGLILYCQ